MSRNDDAQKALQDALALASTAQSPYRRAEALYQQSVLDTQAKQWPKAFEESLESFRQAKLANSAFGMSKAKKAESAALQYLDRPKQELEAMLESLAIARSAKSDAAESMALINLADVYLRRNNYKEVLELSQRSLELANALGNTSTAATNKANIGFALLGLGRIDPASAWPSRPSRNTNAPARSRKSAICWSNTDSTLRTRATTRVRSRSSTASANCATRSPPSSARRPSANCANRKSASARSSS